MWLALKCSKYCGTKNQWHLLCSAKQWCFHVRTLGLRVTLAASTSLPAHFLHLVHTCRLGKQRKILTELWQLGFVPCAVDLTWKFVFLAEVVWCNMDRFWFLFSSLSLLLLGCSLLPPFVFPQWRALTDSTREGMESQGWCCLLCLWGPLPWSYLAFCGKSIFSVCSE